MKEKNKKENNEDANTNLENMIREVCNRLKSYTPTEEMTDFFISELLQLEDTCKQIKGKLTDY
ncbi:hypothetical protein [Butyricimonas virosa]|uniref:hypothetical protein n=1 Tax=Butyricimonas virosa TaxID=544645 RepID=UPI0032BFB1EC